MIWRMNMVMPGDWVCSHSHCSNPRTGQVVAWDLVLLFCCEDVAGTEAGDDTPGDSHDEDNVD